MRRARVRRIAGGACRGSVAALGLLALLSATALPAAESAAPLAAAGGAKDKVALRLTVDLPAPDTVIGDDKGLVYLSGEALAPIGNFRAQDLIIAIDTSESTGVPSGIDANGDGTVSHGEPLDASMFDPLFGTERARDVSDSILAAEIAAVEAVLDRLDPRTTRVGLITFSGKPGSAPPHARTRVQLTPDYEDVRDALRTILGLGSRGHTDILEGVQLAIRELTAAPGALSTPRQDVERRLLMLTDGIATLPVPGAINHNRDLVIREGRTAARARVRIDSFSIGTAQFDPVTANGLARATGGSSAALAGVRDLAERLPIVPFAEIAELRVTNLTRAQPASYLTHGDTGRFGALLQLAEGENVVQVYARTIDGTEATYNVPLRFVRGSDTAPLPRQIESERSRLLERWLGDLKVRTDKLAAERDEGILRQLQEQIAQERKRAQDRSLEIKTDQPAPSPEAPAPD